MQLTNEHLDIMYGLICPYCRNKSKLVNSSEIYGLSAHDYGNMYFCKPCNAWVGCHSGTDKALGRLANDELRIWKGKAHAAFDPIWKDKKMKRSHAYKWLSEKMCIPLKYTHIGMFGVESCKKVVEFCKEIAK